MAGLEVCVIFLSRLRLGRSAAWSQRRTERVACEGEQVPVQPRGGAMMNKVTRMVLVLSVAAVLVGAPSPGHPVSKTPLLEAM